MRIMASTTISHVGDVLSSLLLPPAADGHARFSRAAYHHLAETGLINSDSRVELIDGEIYMMSPIGPPQGSFITRLSEFFFGRLDKKLACRVQLPIIVSDHSEPEPDIAIVRRRDDDYRNEHPTTNDVALLIEVSQSSLHVDLGIKLRLYASAGIREYWVIDVDRQNVVVHRDPAGAQYRTVEQVVAGAKIAPLAAPNCQLDVAWLFH